MDRSSNIPSLDPIAAYDHIANVFPQLSAEHRAYLDGVEALVVSEIPPGSRSLLDVGAGDGTRAQHIAQSASLQEVTLLEPSAEMQRHWPADAKGFPLRAEDLRLVPGVFDVITCLWNVLGHVSPAAERMEALRQFARLVSPAGRVFVDVNHRYNAAQYGALPTLGRVIHDQLFPSDANGDVAVAWDISGIRCSTTGHVFTHREFCLMAAAAGLSIEKRYIVDYTTGQVRRRSSQGHLLYVLRHSGSCLSSESIRRRPNFL